MTEQDYHLSTLCDPALGGCTQMSSQMYCNVDLKPPFWKRTDLGIGRVCNTPVTQDGRCPNVARHIT